MPGNKINPIMPILQALCCELIAPRDIQEKLTFYDKIFVVSTLKH